MLAIVLLTLVALSGIIGIVAGFTYSGAQYHAPGQKKITLDHIFNGTFSANRPGLNWVREG